MVVPEGAILRHPETGLVAGSPFLKGIVAFIFITFAIPGFVYGRVAGTMKNDRDVIDAMAKSMGSMGLYITLVFFAAQFVAFFKDCTPSLLLRQKVFLVELLPRRESKHKVYLIKPMGVSKQE